MKLFYLILAAGSLLAQTSTYPGAVDTDGSLFVVSDNVQSTLTVAMIPSDNVAVVKSGTGFVANMLVTICDSTTVVSSGVSKCGAWEHMKITSVSGQVLTVTRGVAGTTARSHTAGAVISALIDSAHQKVLKDAVIAIETGLGPNLRNVRAYVSLAADGATNDAPALQAAINALSPTGGTLYLPPGPILLQGSGTELLRFPGPAAVNLVGAGVTANGFGTRLLVGSSVGASTDVIAIAPTSGAIVGMKLVDFSITPAAGTPARHGIRIDTTSFGIYLLIIDHLFIDALGGRAIVSVNPSLIDGFFLSTIQNCHLTNGVQFTRLGDAITLFHNSIVGSGIGVEVVSFVPGAAEMRITDNTIVNTGAWVKLGDAFFHPIISGNAFEAINGMTGSNNAALDIDAAGIAGQYALIVNNRISVAGSVVPNLDALRINNCFGCVVRDNVFQQPASAHASTVAWRTTASAVSTNIGQNQYYPSTDKWPTTWADAGNFTSVASRCEEYTISGASLTSPTNVQTLNLFQHPANAVFTGFRIFTVSGFSATNLTNMQISLGDACCGLDYFTTIANIKNAGTQLRKTPPENGTNNGFASFLTASFTGTYSAGGTFAANPVSGSLTIGACWGMNAMEQQ